MSETTGTSLRMLAAALEMEEKGKAYYEKAAQTCRNELGREVFQLLKDYEEKHIERINEIYSSLKSGGSWSEDLILFEVPQNFKAAFRSLVPKQGERVKADTGDVEALEIGIEFESASVKFYEDHLDQAVNKLEKKFTELMAAEEREHLRILSDMRFYYTDPEGWFMEKERAGLDGA
ncbi:MAG: ferritin family protein [Thermodesulfobacteriota bacterium]|nr:ferritin family protein [Thermodesulfobacteriota bacterium]